MSSIIDDLYEIKYNPFKYGSYIAAFYSSISGVDNNLLLAQLIIPLCSHPVYGRKLNNANKTSTIWSTFNAKDLATLYDLQERIDLFQNLTAQSLQYCLANDWIIVDDEKLNISIADNFKDAFNEPKNANKLGVIFSNITVIEIFNILRVKPR